MDDHATKPKAEPQHKPGTDPKLPARNLRLALILASTAFVFFVGFVVKTVFFSHH